MALSCSGVTWVMRIRLEWKVNLSSGRTAWRARRMAGTSVSMVTFELGTIWPMR